MRGAIAPPNTMKDITEELRRNPVYTLTRELAEMTKQRDALLACVHTSPPVLDDGEQEALEKAKQRTCVKRKNAWNYVASCYKADADAARAAIAMAEMEIKEEEP